MNSKTPLTNCLLQTYGRLNNSLNDGFELPIHNRMLYKTFSESKDYKAKTIQLFRTLSHSKIRKQMINSSFGYLLTPLVIKSEYVCVPKLFHRSLSAPIQNVMKEVRGSEMLSKRLIKQINVMIFNDEHTNDLSGALSIDLSFLLFIYCIHIVYNGNYFDDFVRLDFESAFEKTLNSIPQ